MYSSLGCRSQEYLATANFPGKTGIQKTIHSPLRGNKDLDSCPVFHRGKLKIAGMTGRHLRNRTKLLAIAIAPAVSPALPKARVVSHGIPGCRRLAPCGLTPRLDVSFYASTAQNEAGESRVQVIINPIPCPDGEGSDPPTILIGPQSIPPYRCLACQATVNYTSNNAASLALLLV